MSAITNTYTTTQMHGDVMDGGQQKVMQSANVRAGKYLNIQIEVLDAGYVASNQAAVSEAVATFIRSACEAGAQAGLPTSLGDE